MNSKQPDNNFHYIVIGGGMAGASVCYELALTGARVLLLEKENQPGYHASGRSVAFYLEIYGNETVRLLTRYSGDFYRRPPPGFGDHLLGKQRGDLCIARADQVERLHREYRELSRLSTQITLEDTAFARAKVPLLRQEAVAACIWDPSASEIDVAALLQGYLSQARKHGAQVWLNSGVKALEAVSGGWRVSTDGGEYRGEVVINAAGAWADKVGLLAGARPIGLQPKKRTVCQVPAASQQDLDSWPMVGDVGETFYFKPQSGELLLSPADETPTEPGDVQADELDVAIAIDRVLGALDIDIRRVTHKWAGLRTFTADKAPVVGFDSTVDNFFWCAGQGGYGIQMAPGVAKLAASLVRRKPVPDGLRALGFTPDLVSPARCQG